MMNCEWCGAAYDEDNPRHFSCIGAAIKIIERLQDKVTDQVIELNAMHSTTSYYDEYHKERRRAERLQQELERLENWVNDLQSGMYINCVYCGHRYGPEDEVPASMAEVLKEHIEQCPKHPMSKLKAALDILHRLAGECQEFREELPFGVIAVLSEWESFSAD